MKIVLIFLFFVSNLISNLNAEDFISKAEYGKMLYQNPRGVGCDKCHGKKGEGMLIAKYKNFDKKAGKVVNVELKAPKINDLELDEFRGAIRDSKGMMPTYFLTDGEIISLYEYLTNLKK